MLLPFSFGAVILYWHCTEIKMDYCVRLSLSFGAVILYWHCTEIKMDYTHVPSFFLGGGGGEGVSLCQCV